MHTRTHKFGKWILTIQAVACVIGLLNSCSAENNMKKGDAFYAIGEYYNAAAEYKKAYSRTPTKEKIKRGERAWKMAECYRKINYSAKAMGAYQNAVRYKYADDMALLYLAQMQQRQGDYKNAIKNYNAFLEIDPTNKLALNGKKGCEIAPTWKENPTLYTVKKEPNLNSRRADYSPALLGEESDQLYLTSTRTQASGDEISGITGTKNADIFFTKKDDKGKWVPVEGVEGELNSEYDEGAICFSPDGKTMYLTRCSYDTDYPRFAEIYTSQRSDASWSKPSLLTLSKDTLSSYAHPAVSPDGHWLYFVSDMPGGLGGLDIWRIALTEGTLGGVENVGPPINSEGDEMFPTFRPNGDLYFSSNGHPGMGGLDLFCAKLDSTKKEETWYIENLKYPMNSSGDDFGMTFEGMYNRGYFCTSRGDARGWDHIMSFECPEITHTVTGWVYEKDGYELPEGLVYMVGDDGTYLKLPLKSDGSFTQDVKPGVNYVFLGTCKGYLNHKEELEVDTSSVSQEYTLQFALPTISAPVLVRNVLYEFDRAELTESSTMALDSLVDLLNENPNVTIELSSHCDYRGNDEYNEKLSQRRAESVVNYLIEHGIAADRLSPVGYGEKQPKTITRKLAEKFDYLNEGDVLTEKFITALPEEEQQEMCDSLNRRTEFRVLRITYGLFDKNDPIPDEMRKEVELENPSQDPIVKIPRNAAGNLIQADDVPLAPEIIAAKEAAKKAEEAAAAAKKNVKKTKKTKEEEKAERTRMIIEEARKDAEAAAKAEAEKKTEKTSTAETKTAEEKKADAKEDNKAKEAKDNVKSAEVKSDSKTDSKTDTKENAKSDTKTPTKDAKTESKATETKDSKTDSKNTEAKDDTKSDTKSSDVKSDTKAADKKSSGAKRNVTTKDSGDTTTAAEDAKAKEAAEKAKEEAQKGEEKKPAYEKDAQAKQKSKKVKKTKAEKKAEKEAKKKAEAEAKAAKKAEAEEKKKAEAEAKAAKKAAKGKGTTSQENIEEGNPEEKSETQTETQQTEVQVQTPFDTKENIESIEETTTPKKTEQVTKAEKKAQEAAAKEAKKAEDAKAKALKSEEAKKTKAAKEAEKRAIKEEAKKANEEKKAAKEEVKKIEASKSKADKKMEKIARKEETQKKKILEKMEKEQEKNVTKDAPKPVQESAEIETAGKEGGGLKDKDTTDTTEKSQTQVEVQSETKDETSPEAKQVEDNSSETPKNETKEERIKRIMEAAKKDVEAKKAAEEVKENVTETSEPPRSSKASQKAEKARKAAEAKAAKEAKKAEKAERAAAAKKARLEKRAKANLKSKDSDSEDNEDNE